MIVDSSIKSILELIDNKQIIMDGYIDCTEYEWHNAIYNSQLDFIALCQTHHGKID